MLYRRIAIALQTAVLSLMRNPLRASLTASGIWVGVLAVTVVVALGEGADRSIQERFKNLGENLLTIYPRETVSSGALTSQGRLTNRDLESITLEMTGTLAVAPTESATLRLAYGKENTPVYTVGTTLGYFPARNYEVVEGEFWTPLQEATGARVALLGPSVVRTLFSALGASPIGESIRVAGSAFTVIGVLAPKGESAFGSDQDNIVFVPVKAMQGPLGTGKRGEYQQILLKLDPSADGPRLQAKLTKLLRENHGLRPEDADDFSIRDSARFAEAQRGIVTVMRSLLLSIGFISLAIGGIGVMNVMLVGVKERTKEIGARLAIGAHPLDILLQFMIEATLLSAGGGILGVLSSLLLIPPLEAYFGWPIELSPTAIVTATTVSMSVGIAFGLLPARRAAGLDPAEALRSE